MNCFYKKIESGFTMIELIISIFILSVAVVGISSVLSMITILASNTTDKVVAIYLAQEGSEIVRNIRDTNWLKMDANPVSGFTWADGLNNCSSGCEADYKSTATSTWISAGKYLKLDSADGFYNYLAGTDTKFKRKIIVTKLTDVDGDTINTHIMKVVVQVSWDEKSTVFYSGKLAGDCGSFNCITTEGTLYNWYNYANE